MDQPVLAVTLVVALVVVLATLAALARTACRRGVAGSAVRGAMASFQEGWHGTAYETFLEMRAEADRTAPATSPDVPGHGDRRRTPAAMDAAPTEPPPTDRPPVTGR